MVNKRFIKKVLSSISTIAITFVTVGTVLMPYGVQAADSSTTDDTKEDSYYINEKYMTLTEEENIGGAIGYDGSLVLISNSESYSSTDDYRDNFKDIYKLTENSEFRFVDEKGVNQVITNKDENGNKKYDTLSGTLTDAYYTYLKVGKDEKSSLIDKNGNNVKMGKCDNYDTIYFYETDNKKVFYCLCNKINDDDDYDMEIVDANGNTIFYTANCYNFYDLLEYNCFLVMTYEGDNKIGYIVNTDGNIIYSVEAYDAYCSTYGSGENKRTVVKFTSDKHNIYYNMNNGKIIETSGSLEYGNEGSIFGSYYVITDNEYIGYDNDFNVIKTISGQYKNVTYISNDTEQRLILTDSDGLSNVCDKDGNFLFEHKVKIKNYRNGSNFYSSGLLIEDDIDNTEYIIYDGGDKKIELDKVKSVADAKLNEIIGDNAKVKKYTCSMLYYGTGINITYQLENVSDDITILVTYDSNYTTAINQSIEYDDNYSVNDDEIVKKISSDCYHIFEPVEKNITDEYGELRECKYRLVRTYYTDKNGINIVVPTEKYYTKTINTYALCLCNEDGMLYGVDNDGTIIEKHKSMSWEYNLGDSSMECIWSDIRVHGGIGLAGRIEVLDAEKNILFEQEGYNVDKPLENGFSYGYINCGWNIYTYNGKLALSSSKYIKVYNSNKVAYALLRDGRLLKIRNILKNKLEDILPTDSILNITEMDKLQLKVVTGIGQNKSVDDIKKVFNNSGIRIVDADNNELNNSSMIGTGCSIQIIDNNQVSDSAVVMIKGDTDGTGTIDVLDMETIQKSILGIGDTLSGVYKEAGLLNGDDTDEVTVLDMEAIQKDILGIEKINN